MDSEVKFAINHITAPRLTSRALIDMAAALGCIGIELRNDLAGKRLTTHDFFDGEKPSAVGAYARDKGVRVLGLSEVYGFNRWSDKMRNKVELLIAQAKKSGAESISLIPSNDGRQESDEARLGNLTTALRDIRPLVEEAGLIALIEPLGFTTSALRRKREAIDAIAAVDGNDCFRLVHDTFHHFLANEKESFPEMTGIVHISGVVDPAVTPEEMADGHRILVDPQDRLGNIAQIKDLVARGYRGAYSFEPFATSVHADPKLEESLRDSVDYIREQVEKTAA